MLHNLLKDGTKFYCHICEGKDFKEGIKKNGFQYVLCSRCGIVSLYPMPSAEYLDNLYENNFMDLVCDGVKQSDHFSKEHREAYNKEKDLDFRDLEYIFKKEMKILDVGCANGIFLNYLLQMHNLIGEGIDVSRQMVEEAKKDGYICSNEPLENLTGPYDMITLWDTIEHIRNPKNTLLHIHRLLSNGGDLIIQTPCRGFISDAYGTDWIQYQPPYHVHIFDFNSLFYLLYDVNFVVIRWVRFGSGITEPGISIKPVFDRLAKQTGIGDTIVIWAKKK